MNWMADHPVKLGMETFHFVAADFLAVKPAVAAAGAPR
jgi:hypothetical protein